MKDIMKNAFKKNRKYIFSIKKNDFRLKFDQLERFPQHIKKLTKYTFLSYYLMAFGIDWLLPSGSVSIDNGRPELVSFSYSDSSRTADEWLGQGRFLWNISLHLFVSPSYHPSFSGATSTAPFHHLHPSCFTVSIVMCACAHND